MPAAPFDPGAQLDVANGVEQQYSKMKYIGAYMLEAISYYPIFGKPLIMYLGLITLSSFIITAAIGYTNLHGKPIAEFKWHPRMAAISLALAILHGTLGILHYF